MKAVMGQYLCLGSNGIHPIPQPKSGGNRIEIWWVQGIHF